MLEPKAKISQEKPSHLLSLQSPSIPDGLFHLSSDQGQGLSVGLPMSLCSPA